MSLNDIILYSMTFNNLISKLVNTVSVYCARWGVMSCVCILCKVGCHVLCLYTVTGWCVMSCVCILWRVGCHVLCLYTVAGGVSCPVSVYCDGVGCHVLSVHCDGVWCHVLCLYTVTGRGVMSCVCIL